MGNSQQKSDANAAISFDLLEMQSFAKQFETLRDKNDHTHVSIIKLKCLLKASLDQYLSETVCSALILEERSYLGAKNRPSAPNLVSDRTIYVFLSRLLRGNIDEQLAQLYSLIHSSDLKNSDESLNQFSFELFMRFSSSLVSSFFSILKSLTSFKSWQLTSSTNNEIEVFCKAIFVDIPWENDQFSSLDQMRCWLSKSQLFSNMVSHVFYSVFTPQSHSNDKSYEVTLPVCSGADWSKLSSSVLHLSTLFFLNKNLPNEFQSTWHLLFSSRQHGESFGTMLKLVQNQGPSVILIKDTRGFIFGGYASCSWQKTGKFIGDSSCFLFTLYPEIRVYSATGLNSNFMYLNIGQNTLPNGLGMGGQFGYFGLWLDSDYGTGQSKTSCTTFRSERLSGDEQFTIESMEVWRVGPYPNTSSSDEEDGQIESSVLDKNPDAKAVLDMIGKGRLSEGLREKDPRFKQDE